MLNQMLNALFRKKGFYEKPALPEGFLYYWGESVMVEEGLMSNNYNSRCLVREAAKNIVKFDKYFERSRILSAAKNAVHCKSGTDLDKLETACFGACLSGGLFLKRKDFWASVVYYCQNSMHLQSYNPTPAHDPVKRTAKLKKETMEVVAAVQSMINNGASPDCWSRSVAKKPPLTGYYMASPYPPETDTALLLTNPERYQRLTYWLALGKS